MKKITCSFIKDKKLLGFTLAEVLITLTIIGVVAALTIPSLLANVSDKTYAAKRKAFSTRMAQAISQIGTITAYAAKKPTGYTGSETDSQYTADYSSMNFIVEALSKVYKITNVCEHENFSACDFPTTYSLMHQPLPVYTTTYKYLNAHEPAATADRMGGYIPKAAYFRTKNGESIQLYYNSNCVPEKEAQPGVVVNLLDELCVWMVVDLDGARKGPNKTSRDIALVGVFYSDAPYVVTANAMHDAGGSTTSLNAAKLCEGRKIYGYPPGASTLITKEEEITICTHAGYCNSGSPIYWSSSVLGSSGDDYAWLMGQGNGMLEQRSMVHNSICQVKDSAI